MLYDFTLEEQVFVVIVRAIADAHLAFVLQLCRKTVVPGSRFHVFKA
jgi:hypothetical protein